MGEINDLSKTTDFNNLSYYFKSKNSAQINFIGFKRPLHLYTNIINCDINTEKAGKYQKNSDQILLK